MKKILLTLGTISAISAPVAAVVSCGSNAQESVTYSFINFDKEMLYKGTDAFEVNSEGQRIYEKTERMKKLENALLKDKSVDGFIFEGKKYLLANYANKADNHVKVALDKLKAELAKYYPSTFEGANPDYVDTGKVELNQAEFTLPYPGRNFNITDKLPEAPAHTRWIASCPELYRTRVSDGVFEDAWYPLQGWKMPFNEKFDELTFKVKLQGLTGWHVADAQEKEIKFNNKAIPLLDKGDIIHMMKIDFDYSGNNSLANITERTNVFEGLKIKFNDQNDIHLDATHLDDVIKVSLDKTSTTKTFDEKQKYEFNIKLKDFVEAVKANSTEFVSAKSSVEQGGKTYTYYDSSYKVNPGVAPTTNAALTAVGSTWAGLSGYAIANSQMPFFIYAKWLVQGSKDRYMPGRFLVIPTGAMPAFSEPMVQDLDSVTSKTGPFPLSELLKTTLGIDQANFKPIQFYDMGQQDAPQFVQKALGIAKLPMVSIFWEKDINWANFGQSSVVLPTHLSAANAGWYENAPTVDTGAGKTDIASDIYDSKVDGEVTTDITKAKLRLV